jgi:hypothetical protein
MFMPNVTFADLEASGPLISRKVCFLSSVDLPFSQTLGTKPFELTDYTLLGIFAI